MQCQPAAGALSHQANYIHIDGRIDKFHIWNIFSYFETNLFFPGWFVKKKTHRNSEPDEQDGIKGEFSFWKSGKRRTCMTPIG